MKNEIKKCIICGFEDYARRCPFCDKPMWTKTNLENMKKAKKLYSNYEKYYDEHYDEIKHRTIEGINMADEEENALYPDAGPNPVWGYMHKERYVKEKINKYRGDKDIKLFLIYFDNQTNENINECMR